jgi:alkylation response protein AidB-like acyl-CoA dehydrogenase
LIEKSANSNFKSTDIDSYITDEQMVLNRVADAAIDIYGMVSVLSRASRSLNNKYSSSESESAMCQVFCSQVGSVYFST